LKKIFAIALASVLALSLVLPMTVFATPEGLPDDAERVYKFNIIGVKNVKDADMTEDNGKRMFVALGKKDDSVATKIELQQAMNPDGTPMTVDDPGAFDIIDANGTDGTAIFQLPAPGLDPYNLEDKGDADTMSDYSIYIRSLGKPGGWATITTCADLLDSNFAGLLSGQFVSVLNREGLFGGYASIEQVGQEITERPKGKSKFYNVTAELTTIVFKVEVEVLADEDVNGDGVIDENDTEIIIEYIRVPIFDDIIENEYWEYDNHGLKLLQVWIYDNSTDVSEGDADILGD
jgi:hypothetical protein